MRGDEHGPARRNVERGEGEIPTNKSRVQQQCERNTRSLISSVTHSNALFASPFSASTNHPAKRLPRRRLGSQLATKGTTTADHADERPQKDVGRRTGCGLEVRNGHSRLKGEGEPQWAPRPRQKSNYELFNRSNFNIRYWSWNYRGCWHQTCPPMDPRPRFYIGLIPIVRPRKSPTSLFLVTTSPGWDWVICVPAAFLRCGSRFSGSLSGIEP